MPGEHTTDAKNMLILNLIIIIILNTNANANARNPDKPNLNAGDLVVLLDGGKAGPRSTFSKPLLPICALLLHVADTAAVSSL